MVEEQTGAGVAYPEVLPEERLNVEVLHLIAGARLSGPQLAEYDLVLVLREATVFADGGLSSIALKHFQNPAAKVISFDSDLIGTSGERESPLFRPEWSPEVLLGNNYVGRAAAFSGEWLAGIGGITVSERGLWEALLEASLRNCTVDHVSRVLMSETRSDRYRSPDLADAEMVRSRLAAHGVEADVTPERKSLRVVFGTSRPRVSIVIPTRHSRGNMKRLVESLKRTAYPDFELVVVDNGGYSEDNENWYEELFDGADYRVEWWTEAPFNYNRVNNHGASVATGEVLVFLNDDTQVMRSDWLELMVSHVLRPGIGLVGYQLLEGNGRIQHAGVVIGPGGFADNLFSGLKPDSETLIGPTAWYRNSLAVTGACAAITRGNFDEVGGFDERFELMGSDVVLGLDQVLRGRRNLVLPFDRVRHYESLTRGGSVPEADLYASYWRYSPWLRNGDPYVSPNVSRASAIPKLAMRGEPNPADVALEGLGRPVLRHVQRANISEEAVGLLETGSASRSQVNALRASHAEHQGPRQVETVNWFIPEIDMPFFGGLNTAFRIADKLRREKGVRNRFVILGNPHEVFYRSALDAAFAGLGADSEFVFYNGSDESIAAIPGADAAVSTLWLTATHVVKAMCAPRNFYLVQDFEPEFYPASTMFALAEESYRYGLYGICNTKSMYETYVNAYKGQGMYFTPSVDRDIYFPIDGAEHPDRDFVTIFAYARDHFRNCWELVCEALTRVKSQHGRKVRIITAGARYLPETADFVDLGLMDYRATGAIYRETDIGVTMQISRHPSYLPLELMASGVTMVSPDSEWFKWLFRDDRNSATVMRSIDDLTEQISALVEDAERRNRLGSGGLQTIDEAHSDWDAALNEVYSYLCDPS
ncbi:rhamnosyltransferase WsaF family glycosyltransferase [Leucobacter sp. W1153]|uniref:rhamnosyltransferase WsaF family glycosyltransferase n=1 Tax=Leucobacter sp. W1153 TaxID=3439064 RepID=UPI003F2B972E